ncbi:MAG: RluA family pseudouridine synthase [Parcubacteria group bacterium]
MTEPVVIYESANYVVVNKPAGVLMHGVKVKGGGIREELTFVDWAMGKYPEIKKVGDDPETRPGIVHRIDKETSGVVIIARNQKYFEYLKSLFDKKRMAKKYIALVYGEVKNDKGVIEKPIGIKSGTIKRTIHGGKMVKNAKTEYKVIKRYDGYTLLEAYPKTGRTHQIRVHLASIGHPIVGDCLYGGKKEKRSPLEASRQFLHAAEIQFESKPGELVTFTAPLPDELTKVLKSI